jgi:hypothetical protein
MNLLGIIGSQNRAFIIKMVRQSTIKAEDFGHPFIMVVLVLRIFGGRKVHWGMTVIFLLSVLVG